MNDQLPMGRVAFAKSVCVDWVVEHSRMILFSLGSAAVLSFGFFQCLAPILEKDRLGELIPPYYVEFSSATKAIQSGKMEEALHAARALNVKLQKDTAFWDAQDKMVRSGDLLYAYNLLRLATLEREVGTPTGELTALNECLNHMKQADEAEAWAMVGHSMQDGSISLKDYLMQRKRSLELLEPLP